MKKVVSDSPVADSAQEAIDQANKVIADIEADKRVLTTPPPYNIVKTKVLKMHYVNLPVIDLADRFMFRFEEPVNTVWRKAAFRHGPDFPYSDTRVDRLKEHGLAQWFKLVTNGMCGPLPPDVQWMLEVDSCELTECEIVPKKLFTIHELQIEK